MAKNRQISVTYKRIDVPKEYLFTCFYCGDVATDEDHMPPVSRYHDYMAIYDKHAPLMVPSCSECNSKILGNTLQPDIYKRFDYVKKCLIRKAGKYIRLGNMWTEDDLQYADFTGNYARMMESIPEVAADWERRIDWEHWPVSFDGEALTISEITTNLQIGKKKFTNLDNLFEYARKVDKIPTKYLESVLDIVGMKRLEYAYNLCKTVKVNSDAELRKVLAELTESIE
ncbi:hypothetical protein D3C85_681660 [compost metagenome]